MYNFQEWEEKLINSGSIDWEGTRQIQPPPIRQAKPQVVGTTQSVPSTNTAVRILQSGQVCCWVFYFTLQ